MLEQLKTELKIKGYSKKTIDSYLLHLKNFQKFTNKSLTRANEMDVKKYMAHLMDKGNKPKSINLTLSAIRFYFNKILNKPITNIENLKISKKLPVYLTKDEIKKLLASTKNIKHQLIIKIMYSSGLRISEAVSLKIEDINFEEKTIRVLSGKGDKQRMTIISENLANEIKAYTKERESGYLFLGIEDHISPKVVQKVIKKLGKKAGINKNVTPHVLRHSFATEMLNKGVDIRFIQELLGHENLQTTQIYTHVSLERLKKLPNPLDSI